MSEPVLRAERMSKSYASGTRRIEVLRGLDFEVGAGEAVAVIGQSGVGKSTLLHVLGGLDRPDDGRVLFGDRDIFGAGTDALAEYRNRHIGFVFQFHYLLPEFSAVENVAMPFRVGRLEEDGRSRARELLSALGLDERLGHHPSQLSGGEQQRVAIARAVALRPTIVLADEPTGNLDPGTGDRVFRMLRRLQEQEGFALVLATHNGRLAGHCDRILRLEEGRLRPVGEAEAAEYFDGETV